MARRYPLGDHSLPARYARAISTYRHCDLRQAIAQIDGADPERSPAIPISRNSKARRCWKAAVRREAVAPLRHAVQLSHAAPLIEIMLAQALIATNKPRVADEAVELLRAALLREPGCAGSLWPARHGLWPQGRSRACRSRVCASRLRARRPQDRAPARSRAKTRLPVGSPAWVRADDIVNSNRTPMPIRLIIRKDNIP